METLSAFYRIGSGAEVAISANLPQTINLPNQPSGTGVSARVQLTAQGNVTLTVSANGEVVEPATRHIPAGQVKLPKPRLLVAGL